MLNRFYIVFDTRDQQVVQKDNDQQLCRQIAKNLAKEKGYEICLYECTVAGKYR